MRTPRFLLEWQLSRAIGHRRPRQFVTIVERRNEASAQLLCHLLITEQIPASVRDLSPDATLGYALGPYGVVVPAEYLERAYELLAAYDEH